MAKKLGIKLPKTNNTSEQGNKIYGNDVDEMQEPQREDLLMKSLKEVVEKEYSMPQWSMLTVSKNERFMTCISHRIFYTKMVTCFND